MADYGQSQYGTSLYADGSQSIVPPDLVPVDLLAYLPGFYRDILEFCELLHSEGEELGELWFWDDGVRDQYFVSTASWGLGLWEQELGIRSDPTRPVERRREQIKAKLRGAGTTTRQMIIDTAAAFSGGEVDVIEYPDEYRFVVRFIGVLGIPPNMPGFIAMLDQIKPTHLAYSFEYTYTTWGMLTDLTWGQANTQTWGELKTYGGE